VHRPGTFLIVLLIVTLGTKELLANLAVPWRIGGRILNVLIILLLAVFVVVVGVRVARVL
jgi:hypothetical protein